MQILLQMAELDRDMSYSFFLGVTYIHNRQLLLDVFFPSFMLQLKNT